jgi:hypothetical protein
MTPTGILSAIIAGIMNNTGNKTFMQGISDFVELTNDPGQNIRKYANQMVASQIPYSALQRSTSAASDASIFFDAVAATEFSVTADSDDGTL